MVFFRPLSELGLPILCFSLLVNGGGWDNVELSMEKRRIKISDDYSAKVRLWAAHPRVLPAPGPFRLPHFRSRRFSSHAEMNAWKAGMMREIAQSLPAPGK